MHFCTSRRLVLPTEIFQNVFLLRIRWPNRYTECLPLEASLQKRSYYFLLFVVVLGIISGILYTRVPYKLGLDVKGGIRFTYAVHLAKGVNSANESMDQVLSKTQRILQNRISGAGGLAESTIYTKNTGGVSQVIVEIPGVSDPDKAQKMIGTSASLKVYWAKTVNPANPAITYREYSPLNSGQDSGVPSVDFVDNNTHETLKPGDPGYKKMLDSWQLLATGNDIKNAQPHDVGNGHYQPDINFNSKAGNVLQQWSIAHKDQGEQVAFVLDGTVLQIAPVAKGQNLGSQITVEGTFSTNWVKSLCSLINAGSLPVDLHLVGSETISPSIGALALSKMIFAGSIAFGVICLFLIVYYGLPGFVAAVALSLYVLFTLTVLKLLGSTFSLAAISGFVLSVGMAVDANILVFERFKEEIKRGRDLHKALELGFRRALSAIIDSNACSIITALILAYFGTGPVKGFATALALGVAISFFTAVSVTRSLLFFLTDSGLGNNTKLYALNRNWFGEHLEERANSQPLNVVNRAKTWFAITSLFIIGGAIFLATGGLKFNVEFLGGLEATYIRTNDFPSQQKILQNLASNGVKGANVQFSENPKLNQKYVDITVPGKGFGNLNETQRNQVLIKDAGLPPNSQTVSSSFVGPEVQKEVTNDAIYGVVFSFLAIILYLGLRFGFMVGSVKNGMRFGLTAIIAGAKDVFVIFGVAAFIGKILSWELSSLFIPAMLTVIGYTVHDKIVIFDRIRENLRSPLPGETFEHLANRSVTQSIARSINTAAAVVVTLLILAIFGTTTNDLKFFLIIMVSGIAWGTYSSIFTAAPLLNWWENVIGKKYGPTATLLESARQEISRERIVVKPVVVGAGASVNGNAPSSATQSATNPVQPSQYGQVRRRASAVERSKRIIDEDDD